MANRHSTSRALLAASAVVPLATTLPNIPAIEASEAVAPVAAGGPLDVVSWSFSVMDEHADSPLYVRLRGGAWQSSTMDELRSHLDGWPFGCDYTSSATLWAQSDSDGEMLATPRETRDAGRALARTGPGSGA
jgi:hypothetical protein